VFGLGTLAVTGISFTVPGTERPISFDQLVENFVSVGTESGDTGDLQETKEWRLNLWHAIIQDTVHGPYFWTGMGFGENLVSHYGFQLDAEETVRDPHNGHISMLARAGVPGILLWIFVHGSWAAGMVDGYIRANAARRKQWAGLFMWLLIYWLMIVINCSFDPYIEGPMGGVWLWCVYGAGVAAMWLRGSHPDLFDPVVDEFDDEPDALSDMAEA
jgi:O-antigen ligase